MKVFSRKRKLKTFEDFQTEWTRELENLRIPIDDDLEFWISGQAHLDFMYQSAREDYRRSLPWSLRRWFDG